VNENELLAQEFEAHRTRLRSVAYRMLGSPSEADDAVQEAWLRLSRSDTAAVQNLGGWLTTVVGRVCLDMLRSRTTRREDPLEDYAGTELPSHATGPEDEAVLADSVGFALLVVLDTLTPADRLSFVLHDMFAVPFDEIAPIVGRSADAAKMLASRARRRVQGTESVPPDRARQREVVEAFLAASRGGEFDALLALLDPDVVLRADAAAVQTGASSARGAADVAGTFSGRARAARLALINGAAGLVWAQGGVPRVVFDFTVVDGQVVAIDLLADAERISQLEVELL
jgi:RNA polymerase sigma factor (sigma-70 family)